MPTTDLKNIANEYQKFIDQWKWQLHITLSFRRPVHTSQALKQGRAYLNKLKREQPQLKFAGAVLATKGETRCHVHVLLLCDNRYPVTLKALSIFDLKHNWTQGRAEITDSGQWSNETITHYLSKKKNLNLSEPDSYDLDFYRPNALRQLQREK